MSGAQPFDPAKLAGLAAFAAKVNAMSAPPAIDRPVVIDEHGIIAIPHPLQVQVFRASLLHDGVTTQWAPMEMQGGLLLAFWGGQADQIGSDLVTAFMTRDALRRHIADLQAIEAAL
jgi:hypothetical protein